MAQQANAQGITTLNSSGDSGGGGCDIQGVQPVATFGSGISFPANLPEVTGVGGTTFNDAAGGYWSTINSLTNGTALSYIPEAVWNESSLNRGTAFFRRRRQHTLLQAGLANRFRRSRRQRARRSRCRPCRRRTRSVSHHLQQRNRPVPGVRHFGPHRPPMAGIVALLNQYQVKQGFQKTAGLGNINPQLYRLAQAVPGAFHDITAGNNMVSRANRARRAVSMDPWATQRDPDTIKRPGWGRWMRTSSSRIVEHGREHVEGYCNVERVEGDPQ